MSFSKRRYDKLRRLGIELLPAIVTSPLDDASLRRMPIPSASDLPVRMMPVPGRRCPRCLAKGQTIWVIPGKKCPACGTEVN
ncbi:hypothetical protein BAUCODRAFT_248537 [Baudoinia panamericana UAMH 10762]|uniref:Uncharacterized protein n=1 Tax=Baudoinia panamericana (strain UAMH 10762) TaxID=717646 RepID=M2MQB0_BAUPA|nr:uncharacterized protein BAUCODRAFT_248537 [Baudoinia panamericana UAMH 10762]EMC93663.1 hypothetical protein BAUCODRAFT_248537 [Baudoinia panamericana UAMH 10762]